MRSSKTEARNNKFAKVQKLKQGKVLGKAPLRKFRVINGDYGVVLQKSRRLSYKSLVVLEEKIVKNIVKKHKEGSYRSDLCSHHRIYKKANETRQGGGKGSLFARVARAPKGSILITTLGLNDAANKEIFEQSSYKISGGVKGISIFGDSREYIVCNENWRNNEILKLSQGENK